MGTYMNIKTSILALISLVTINNLNAEVSVTTHHVKRFLAGFAYGPFGLVLRSDKQVMHHITKNARPEDDKIMVAGALTQFILAVYLTDNYGSKKGFKFLAKFPFNNTYAISSLASVALTELTGALYFKIPLKDLNKSTHESSRKK
jgi:hypothetical protein